MPGRYAVVESCRVRSFCSGFNNGAARAGEKRKQNKERARMECPVMDAIQGMAGSKNRKSFTTIVRKQDQILGQPQSYNIVESSSRSEHGILTPCC
jgi:hypothetical protein